MKVLNSVLKNKLLNTFSINKNVTFTGACLVGCFQRRLTEHPGSLGAFFSAVTMLKCVSQ